MLGKESFLLAVVNGNEGIFKKMMIYLKLFKCILSNYWFCAMLLLSFSSFNLLGVVHKYCTMKPRSWNQGEVIGCRTEGGKS